MPVAAQRGLYDPTRDTPTLTGTRCRACAAVFFPPVGIGCPACGAFETELEATDLAAAGTLHSMATVHRHRGRDIEAPFVIGEIQLTDGPLVRATMTVAETDLQIGQAVAATWVTVGADDDGNDIVEPRFAPREGDAG